MSIGRDFWLNCRAAIRTKRINKKIVIPSFSVNCGPVGNCMDTLYTPASTPGYFVHAAPSMVEILDNLTVEAWFKTNINCSTGQHYGLITRKSNVGVTQWTLGLNTDGSIFTQFRSDLVDIIKTTGVNEVITLGEWNHIAFTKGSGNVNFYINGAFIRQSAFPGPGPLDSTANCSHYLGYPGLAAADYFPGFVDECRVWDTLKTDEQILTSYRTMRNIVAGDGIDDDLKAYYRYNAVNGANTFKEAISNENVVSSGVARITTANYFPHRFGSSFICQQFEFACDNKCSLKFPVIPPDNADHAMFVSWIDEDTGETIRRLLYLPDSSIGVLGYSEPINYNGEVLPLRFNIEIWNIDGLPTANLEDDFTIYTSLTSDPVYQRDHTSLVADNPTSNNALAFNFPANNPITPNVIQTY